MESSESYENSERKIVNTFIYSAYLRKLANDFHIFQDF